MWYNISHEVIVVLDLLEWLQNNQLGEMVFTTLVSMVPVVELRGGLPFGVALGLPYWAAYLSISGAFFNGCAAACPGWTIWWTGWRPRPT